MITGAHSIIYSSNAEADRRFFKEILKFPHVDAGEGWLIFGLPPSEVAIHPDEENGKSEFYLVCDNISEFVKTMQNLKVECTTTADHGWGLLVYITLPGGSRLGIYEARHERPNEKSKRYE